MREQCRCPWSSRPLPLGKAAVASLAAQGVAHECVFPERLLSFFNKYDPWSPRALRVTLLCAVLISNMYWSAFFYAFIHGSKAGAFLSTITINDQIFISLITCASMLPIQWLLTHLFRAPSAFQFKWRYPALAAATVRANGSKFCQPECFTSCPSGRLRASSEHTGRSWRRAK